MVDQRVTGKALLLLVSTISGFASSCDVDVNVYGDSSRGGAGEPRGGSSNSGGFPQGGEGPYATAGGVAAGGRPSGVAGVGGFTLSGGSSAYGGRISAAGEAGAEAGSGVIAGSDSGGRPGTGGIGANAGEGGIPGSAEGGFGGAGDGGGGQEPRAVRIEAGNFHTCALLDDRTVRCWGANFVGALGNGTTGPSICVNNTAQIGCSTTPVPVLNLADVKDISLGNYHTCAIRLDGSLSCWGLNANGQLGIGMSDGPEICVGIDYSIPCSTVPAPVASLRGVRSISAADESHTCAVLDDGSVQCWGLDAGQFGSAPNVSTCRDGDWDFACSTTPIMIPNIEGVASIQSSTFHTCALASNRTVWCWGYGISGEIGNGSTDPSLDPVRVPNLSEVVQLATGGNASCVLRGDGTVWCWGSNNVGQLGIGSTVGPFICAGPTQPPFDIPCAPVPVPGPDLPGVVELAAGGRHMCALLAEGTVACWGANDFGQLGIGAAVGPETCYAGWLSWPVACSTAPVLVPNLEGVVAIGAGAEHTCAVLADGSVRCWGYNVFGQIGNGSTIDAHRPELVPLR